MWIVVERVQGNERSLLWQGIIAKKTAKHKQSTAAATKGLKANTPPSWLRLINHNGDLV